MQRAPGSTLVFSCYGIPNDNMAESAVKETVSVRFFETRAQKRIASLLQKDVLNNESGNHVYTKSNSPFQHGTCLFIFLFLFIFS